MADLLDRLGGAFVPLVTPVDRTGGLDLDSLVRLVRHVLAGGVDGIWVCGTSGEFHLLDDAERTEVLRVVVEEVAGRVPVVAHVGDGATRRVIPKAEAALEVGADAISVITPYFVPYSSEEVKRHHRSVARAIGSPILAYQHPMSGKPSLPVEDLVELTEEGVLIGIKESSADFEYFRRILEATRDLPFRAFHGAGLHAHLTLGMGSAGMVSLVANLLPRTCARLAAALRDGATEEIPALRSRIVEVSRSIERAVSERENWAPTLSAYRLLLCEKGVLSHDGGFEPSIPLTPTEREEVLDETLGLCEDAPLRPRVACAVGMEVQRENPANLDEVAVAFTPDDPAGARNAMDRVAEAAPMWARTPKSRRLEILARARDLVARDREVLAGLITLENGKLLREARGEVDGSLADWDHQLASVAAAEERIEVGSRTPGVEAHVRREPRGPFLLITPWNFPLATIVRKLVPALALGNTVVTKASELTPGTARHLFQLLAEAGLPEDAASLVLAEGAHVGPTLLGHEALAGVSFTGSTAVGRTIARSVVDRDVEVQLEMGGKNALVCLGDADLDAALDAVMLAGFGVAGQWCTSTSRLLLEESIHDSFLERLVRRVADLRIGDGRSDESDMGPLISRDQQRRFERAVRRGLEGGARLETGGETPCTVGGRPGHWAVPTVFSGVESGSWLATEEVFGPLVSVIRVEGPEHALGVAGDTDYGLSFSVFTSDPDHARLFVEGMEAGMCHVNLPTPYREPALPLGGWCGSGRGIPECGDLGPWLHTRMKSVYQKDLAEDR